MVSQLATRLILNDTSSQLLLGAGGQEVRGALQHAGLLQARLCPGGEAEEVEGGGHRQTSRILHRGPGIASKASDSVLHIADCG